MSGLLGTLVGKAGKIVVAPVTVAGNGAAAMVNSASSIIEGGSQAGSKVFEGVGAVGKGVAGGTKVAIVGTRKAVERFMKQTTDTARGVLRGGRRSTRKNKNRSNKNRKNKNRSNKNRSNKNRSNKNRSNKNRNRH